MPLLSRHLEQISLSSESIATLPFPPPKIFTNALLSSPDITSLIRDTEPHERALFSVPPPPPPPSSTAPFPVPDSKSRRQTVFSVASGGEVTTAAGASSRVPRRNTAVAAVLGPELHSEVRETEGRGEFDIEVLLRGVDKLNAVYEVRGVPERVRNIRARYGRLRDSVDFYETKVQRLNKELDGINRGGSWQDDENEDEEGGGVEEAEVVEVTDEDLRREEEEIRELEKKKRELEERVTGMERDLGGLLRHTSTTANASWSIYVLEGMYEESTGEFSEPKESEIERAKVPTAQDIKTSSMRQEIPVPLKKHSATFYYQSMKY
ncbi:Uncharacterized protein BP5553_08228 [Venustampulla echinocandica]|uniref:DASH complex subunit SPC34 n=1 Tax=Venustampulla echinocandica TaxID=2656787 RepID=A0A370TG42_9HELO|nr:Uncharacterized protein BP5553_08228 [Venustampulla echinocandica]RDL33860.1 Uncharacterized protein BP5553_08228 [Venustampulla echinocandica]